MNCALQRCIARSWAHRAPKIRCRRSFIQVKHTVLWRVVAWISLAPPAIAPLD